jgi:hypothetical protein
MEIYKSINKVMEKFTAVHKDGSVGFGNNSYKVVTYDNIISKLRGYLIDEQIIINPLQIGDGVYTESLTAKGGKKLRYDALYEVEYISAKDGSKLVSRVGVSADTFGDDKGPSKATTIAVKNSILKVFSLESSDEAQEELKNHINDKQFNILKGLIDSTKTDLIEFNAYYNASTLKEFPQSYYQGAVEMLQKKLKAKK